MLFGLDDDELISAAYEIPDLQTSDLQREGPYYLAHDENRINLNYYQNKNKYEIYFRLKFYIKKITLMSAKCRRIKQSKAFQMWKAYSEDESLRHNCNFINKFIRAIRVAQNYREYVVLKRFYRWRNCMEINRTLETQRKLRDNLGDKCEIAKRSIRDINSEIKSYEKAIDCFKENENNYIKKIEIMKENQTQLKCDINQNYKLLRSLQRENENIREKFDMLEDAYNTYLHSMNSLSLS